MRLRILVGIAIALTTPVALTGFQSDFGELSGRVTDTSGNPVAGVEIVIAAPSHRTPYVVMSGPNGSYRFTSLRADSYTISIRLDHFLEYVREGVVIDNVKPTVLNHTLQLAAPATRASAEVGSAITQHRVEVPSIPVRLETPFGDIDLASDTVNAPISAANFLRYVDGGFYDSGRFHLTTRPDTYHPVLPNRPPMEIIQAGINPASRPGFPPIPLERTSVTDLKHVVGVVSMARGGPDTATSDFCILLNDQPSLDFGGKRFDDGQGAAAFGRVTAGLEVVKQIQQRPVSERQPTPDNPLTHTQNLTPPVAIAKACRISRELDSNHHLVSRSHGCPR